MLRSCGICFGICIFFFFSVFAFASTNYNLHAVSKVKFDITDVLSLQRGAKIFFENCVSCHGIKYVRYKNLAEGLDFVSSLNKNEVLSDFIQKNWTFNVVNINSRILSNMSDLDAVNWFGKPPQDLSLITRFRGSNWVYAYLKSFYYDNAKPWKVNNLVFPDVAMPHVLVEKQGLQKISYKDDGFTVNNLGMMQSGTMTETGFDSFLYDLVNFLTYVGEPVKALRIRIGLFVVSFFVLFTIVAYLLKKEFWKDIR